MRIPIGNNVSDPRSSPESPASARALASKPGWRSVRRLLERSLWSVALVAIGFVGYVELDRTLSETRQSRRLVELAQATSAAAPALGSNSGRPASRRPPPANGEPIGRLEIPGVGISAIVAAGTDNLTLRRGVGHIDGTALPGDPGNIGLAGHRDTIFRGIRKLRPADRILLVTAAGTFEYAVDSLRTVAPDQNDVLAPSSQPMLTLVTCFPFDFVGPAPLRYIVRAREIGRPGAPAHLEDAAARP